MVVVVHTCNPSTQEDHEFKASLGYIDGGGAENSSQVKEERFPPHKELKHK
jgi:hypothetical protein